MQQRIEAMLRDGTKQEVIAMQANISQATVSRILSGKVKRMRYSTWAKLAGWMG